MQGHGTKKFAAARLIASSAKLNWPALAVEVRSHVAGPIPAFVTEHTELTLILAGDGSSTVLRAANGVRQQATATRGTTFIIPVDTHEEATFLTSDIPEVMHIYLSQRLFDDLATEDHLPLFNPRNIRYVSGLHDASLNWLGAAVARELRQQTSSASILMESLGLSLAERMLVNYSDGIRQRTPAMATRRGLDQHRLRRVLAYIEEQLEADITIRDLAEVACLSPFHFARVFCAATGTPPHRYISGRRLALAKRMLRETDRSLADVARLCCFSSPANFARAFSSAVGSPPGKYRTERD